MLFNPIWIVNTNITDKNWIVSPSFSLIRLYIKNLVLGTSWDGGRLHPWNWSLSMSFVLAKDEFIEWRMQIRLQDWSGIVWSTIRSGFPHLALYFQPDHHMEHIQRPELTLGQQPPSWCCRWKQRFPSPPGNLAWVSLSRCNLRLYGCEHKSLLSELWGLGVACYTATTDRNIKRSAVSSCHDFF